MPGERLESAEAFLMAHARLLERRQYEVAFRGGDPETVRRALAAYQNEDGGFGHALEPDLRAPGSQPIFTHLALTALREAGLDGGPMVERACAYLAGVAGEDGALPYVLPDAMAWDRARHWEGDFALAPSLNATAGVAAGLHALGARHEWLDRATAWCLAEIAAEPAYSGHTLLNVFDLLQNHPRPAEAAPLIERATARLFEADHVLLETPVRTYGLTPLHFAPTPDAPLRSQFTDERIEAHLEDLAARQQDDGGWPIHWTPPAGRAAGEWRGRWTLDALRVLRAYDRLT